MVIEKEGKLRSSAIQGLMGKAGRMGRHRIAGRGSLDRDVFLYERERKVKMRGNEKTDAMIPAGAGTTLRRMLPFLLPITRPRTRHTNCNPPLTFHHPSLRSVFVFHARLTSLFASHPSRSIERITISPNVTRSLSPSR